MSSEERGPEMAVDFVIGGRGFDTDLATRVIGREPSRAWHQEREHLRKRSDLHDTAWMVSIGWTEMDSVNQAVERILEQVWPHRENILSFVDQHGLSASVSVSVRIWGDRPLYDLLPGTMRKLGEMNVEFGLDIYDYSEEGSDAQ